MKTHTVKFGDTLAKIANEHRVPLYALVRVNPQFSDPNKIFPKQVVYIPATWGPPPVVRPKPPESKPKDASRPNGECAMPRGLSESEAAKRRHMGTTCGETYEKWDDSRSLEWNLAHNRRKP